LDELYSLEWYHGRLRLKRSFGSAFKVFGRSWLGNGSTYLKLGLLTFLVVNEPMWMQDHLEQQRHQRAEQRASEQDNPQANPLPVEIPHAEALLEDAKKFFR